MRRKSDSTTRRPTSNTCRASSSTGTNQNEALDLAQSYMVGNLRRVSAGAHHALPADASRRRHERHGTRLASACNPGAAGNGDLSPLPWMLTLPSIAVCMKPTSSARGWKAGRCTTVMADIVSYTPYRIRWSRPAPQGAPTPSARARAVGRRNHEDFSGHLYDP